MHKAEETTNYYLHILYVVLFSFRAGELNACASSSSCQVQMCTPAQAVI